MLVKFTECVAGARHCYYAEEVVDLPPDLAQHYLDMGVASLHTPEERVPLVESASVAPASSATLAPPKPRRRAR